MKKILFLIVISSIATASWNSPPEKSRKVVNLDTSFNSTKLMKALQDSGIFFPEIVWAQSALETGNWKSSIFKRNNNLFGMKLPKRRSTTAIGTYLGHAKYKHWLESVSDFRMWQKYYNIDSTTTEEEYYAILKNKYCPTPSYVATVKKLIPRALSKQEELEDLEEIYFTANTN